MLAVRASVIYTQAMPRLGRHRRLKFLLWVGAFAGFQACTHSKATRRQAKQAQFSEKQAEIDQVPQEIRPPKRRRSPAGLKAQELDRLAIRLGVTEMQPIEGAVRGLKRVFAKMDQLDLHLDRLEAMDREVAQLEALIRKGKDRDQNTLKKQEVFGRRASLEEQARRDRVRILHLGDSHIAADYITRTIRERLQSRFGNGGRGFVAADQRTIYGGRRIKRTGWRRIRIVDKNGPGQAMGFASMKLISTKNGVDISYKLSSNEKEIVAYYLAHPGGPPLTISADGFELERFPTRSTKKESRALRVDVDLPPPEPQSVSISADAPQAEVFGVSFEAKEPGLIYDSIGPVGADAAVYLTLDPDSLAQNLQALRPDMIVLMVGGNDALAVRKGVRSLEEVENQHLKLLERLQKASPQADCLVWAPMDAGEPLGRGRIGTKKYIPEIRDLQRRVAEKAGCAFWDTFDAMGGEGSFGRWLKKGIMNKDMVHPRSKGGDLMGHIFSKAFMQAYLSGE